MSTCPEYQRETDLLRVEITPGGCINIASKFGDDMAHVCSQEIDQVISFMRELQQFRTKGNERTP